MYFRIIYCLMFELYVSGITMDIFFCDFFFSTLWGSPPPAFLGEHLNGSPPENTRCYQLVLPSPAQHYVWTSSMFACSHRSFCCYIMFHCMKIPHSIHFTVDGLWKSLQFITITKTTAIHVFSSSLCAHIQEFFYKRYLEMGFPDLRAWASSTGLSSISQLPEQLDQVPLLSASVRVPAVAHPRRHVTSFHDAWKQWPDLHVCSLLLI